MAGNIEKIWRTSGFCFYPEKKQRYKINFGQSLVQTYEFLGLRRVFGWHVFSFYREIWYAPGKIVFMQS
jgi:hypothetical protein